MKTLAELAELCDSGTDKVEQIKGASVIDIADKKVSLKLQMDLELALKNDIQTAYHYVLIRKQNTDQGTATELRKLLIGQFQLKQDRKNECNMFQKSDRSQGISRKTGMHFQVQPRRKLFCTKEEMQKMKIGDL